MPVARSRPEQQRLRRTRRDCHRAIGDAPQIRQPLAANPLQFPIRKRRVLRHIRQQIQRLFPVRRQRLSGNRGVLARCVGMQLRPQELHLIRDLLTAARRRPLSQHSRRKACQARLPRRIRHAARPHKQPLRHKRQPRLFKHNHIHPVGQRSPLRRRRTEPRRLRRLGHLSAVKRRRSRAQRILRQNPQPRPAIAQHNLRRPPDVVGRNRHISLQIAIDARRIALIGVVEVELIRPPAKAAHALQLPYMLALYAVFGARNLALARRVLPQPLYLFAHYRLDFGALGHPIRGNLNEELARDFLPVVIHAHIPRDPPLVHQPLVQPRTLAVAQYHRHHIQMRLQRVKRRPGWPHQIQARQLNAVAYRQRYIPAKIRVHPPNAVDGRPRRQIPEVALRQRPRLAGVNVPRDSQACVGRRVVLAKEFLHILQSRRVQVFLRAYRGPVVRMRRGKHQRLQRQIRHPVWPVFVALTPLILHHIPLHIEDLLVKRIQQKAHPVRLQPQRELQVIGRHILPVVRAVVGSGAVQVRAHLLQRIKETLLVML